MRAFALCEIKTASNETMSIDKGYIYIYKCIQHVQGEEGKDE
jgi:hypothetical protein